MAVSGACKTPAVIPPIPAKTALPMGIVSGPKIIFVDNAKMYPRRAPPKIAGANTPATPPAPTVSPVRIGFKAQAINKTPNNVKPWALICGMSSFASSSEYPINKEFTTS